MFIICCFSWCKLKQWFSFLIFERISAIAICDFYGSIVFFGNWMSWPTTGLQVISYFWSETCNASVLLVYFIGFGIWWQARKISQMQLLCWTWYLHVSLIPYSQWHIDIVVISELLNARLVFTLLFLLIF